MKRFLLALTIGIATVGIMTMPATASNNPHHEEQDGCDHGATGEPCRTDPQTDHGKDCEMHGNHGGMNEDHCDTTTTTQPPTTTTTTIPASPTTTTTTSDGKTGSPSTTTTTSTTPTNDSSTTPIPSLGCMTPDGFPYLTNIEQGGCPAPSAPEVPTVPAAPIRELPHTGWDAGLLFVIGIAILAAGLSCWFASYVLPDDE